MNLTRRLVCVAFAILFLGVGCRVERTPALSPFAAGAGAIVAAGDRDADADEPRDPPANDGGATAGSGGSGAGIDAGAVAASDGASSPESGDGSAGSTAGAGSDRADGAGGTAVDSSTMDGAVAGDRCEPEVLACNPVTNQGCPPTMQCAVDLLADVLAGYCIFSTPMPTGCFNSGVTESCAPGSTCFEFECRTLCFCDDDCMEGQCCVDPVGSHGFKVCGGC